MFIILPEAYILLYILGSNFFSCSAHSVPPTSNKQTIEEISLAVNQLAILHLLNGEVTVTTSFTCSFLLSNALHSNYLLSSTNLRTSHQDLASHYSCAHLYAPTFFTPTMCLSTLRTYACLAIPRYILHPTKYIALQRYTSYVHDLCPRFRAYVCYDIP
ncbi:hypothetical protein Pcinc_017711 [Petrolisthes cinctipes]|uniref:Uncharacterized protein n=1 Tax=Petrolisthes cinctipes TaxID=88211 RepID=A0AAE1KNG8_PETCI|nr:hypothetical protein Pcinc_017711 [Petrolisthes cinctipes]